MSVAGAIKQEVLDELRPELQELVDAAVAKALKTQAKVTAPANPNPPKPAAPKATETKSPSNASQK
jgi:hypothetical protein